MSVMLCFSTTCMQTKPNNVLYEWTSIFFELHVGWIETKTLEMDIIVQTYLSL